MALGSLTAAQTTSSTTTLNGDADLGKVVGTTSGDPASTDESVGTVDPNYTPVLPFTEQQERKRQELELKYAGQDDLGIQIDSIEPEGGPITGETRVLVHGGPFRDMELLYPRPKCKFGANNRVV